MEVLSKSQASQIEELPVLETQNMNKFKSQLASKNGLASVLVHPFFPEINYCLNADYVSYLSRLNRSINRYQKMQIPMLVFEEWTRTKDLGRKIEDLGVKSGVIFTIATDLKDPKPKDTELLDLTKRLKSEGLKKAIVSGSLFILDDKELYYPIWNSHPLRKKYHFRGCVGAVLNTFSSVGIYSIPAYATYPGRGIVRK